MNKTITIDPETGSVMVEQRDITEGVGVSSDGFKINTGHVFFETGDVSLQTDNVFSYSFGCHVTRFRFLFI